MTLIEFIRKALKEKGIDEKYAEKVQKIFNIQDEASVSACIDMFKDNILPDISTPKAKDTDVEAAKKAAIEEYERTHNLIGGKPVEKPVEVKLDGLDPNVKALIENQSAQLSALTTLVTGIVTSQSKSQKLDLVRAKMKGKVDDDLLEEFVGRVNLDSENLDAEIESQIGTYNKLQQKFINKAVESGNYEPAAGGVSDSDFDGFLKTKGDTTPAFKGAEI